MSEEIGNTAIHSELDSHDYDASHIRVLEGLEPVRQRPGMYIGSTDARGLHHMVQEIVDNSVDEALAGYCTTITTILKEDGSVCVHDNGRGMPVDKHQKTGKSGVETIFTVLHAGGKFDKSSYKISGGLHGVGASVVNALSEWLEVIVHKNGRKYFQRFERGVPMGEIQDQGESDKVGTTVMFMPDDTIFETVEFSQGIEIARMKQSAYLTPGVTFNFINEKTGYKQRFYFEGGIKTWLRNLVGEQEKIGNPVYVNQEGKDCLAEIAFQFVNGNNDNTISFVNNIPTTDGGSHVLGFRSALLTIINEICKEKDKMNKKIGEFQYADVTDGLYAIVSVKIPEPQFEGQTKGRLGNSYVRKEVETIVYNYLKEFFSNNEEEFNKIFEKIELAARARLAAKFAKEGTEMYIVEGDSAGGSAKQGRDSSFQAILPLRGKILNTEQASIQKIIANNEVKALITAIGAGIKESFDLEGLRYEKIIIMTDADVDGAHIRTLLLTFFFRFMRPLVENGHVYAACPPIYKFQEGKRELYVYDEDHKPEDYGMDGKKTEIQRYKGLGEMNAEQLWSTTMDPNSRTLNQITVEDAEEADRLFRILMGEDVQSRKHFILTHAKSATGIDI